MRSVLSGFFLILLGSFSAPAGVLYSFSQPASPPGVYPIPAIDFDFTVPSLLTSSTIIPASDINAPVIPFMGLDLSVLSITIDPGLNGDAPYVGSRGVGFIAIKLGRGSQQIMGEGVCFDSNGSCYSSLSPVGAEVFDHFGTYRHGDMYLTISSTDPSQTAIPEPRLEAIAGFLVLLTAAGITRRTAHLMKTKLAS